MKGRIIVPDKRIILSNNILKSGTKIFWKDKTINNILRRTTND